MQEIRAGRGTVQVPGTDSPYRNRSVEENLELFRGMRDGKYAEGEKVLRAKIDMAHPNMLFRDPLMYRIIHADHHRTGNKWCIYPMYDYAHGQSDRLFPGRKYRTLCLPMWLGVCIGRLSSFIAAALRLSHVPFDPSYYALKTVSSNLDFVDKSFLDGALDTRQVKAQG